MKIPLVAFLMALPLAAQPTAGIVQSFQLPNGLRVLLLEDHQHPMIRLQLRAVWAPAERREAPPSRETTGKAPAPEPMAPIPLEPLALRVLDQCSAGNRSRMAFNRAVEERGLSLQLSSGPDGPVWNLSGGSPEAESAFALLADAATRPIPEGGDLDIVRLRLIHELHELGSKESARSNFFRMLERPDLVLEPITEKSLGQAHLEAIQRFIVATLRPSRAVLAISGDLNLSQARQLAQVNFGAWNEANAEAAPVAPTAEAGSNGPMSAVLRPPTIVPSDRSETSIALPFRTLDGKQRAAQDLLGLWLPRRLGQHRCLVQPGAMGWRSLVLTTEAPEKSIREELLALKKSGLKAEDLEQSKVLWIAGRRALALHPNDQVSFAAKASLLGAEPSEQEIRELDLATFNETARLWLNLDSALVLVFGGNQRNVPKTN